MIHRTCPPCGDPLCGGPLCAPLCGAGATLARIGTNGVRNYAPHRGTSHCTSGTGGVIRRADRTQGITGDRLGALGTQHKAFQEHRGSVCGVAQHWCILGA